MIARVRGLAAADRLCVASFLVDFAHYLVFGAIPFQAIRLGAGPFELGLIPSLYAATYVGASMLAGKLSDHMGRLALVRTGIAVFALSALAIASVHRLATLLWLVPVTGAALGLFWPPVQAAISDVVDSRGLARAIARFNVAWCSGKGAGFLLAGVITQADRAEYSVLAGIAPLAAAWFALPRRIVAASAPRPIQEPTSLDAGPVRISRRLVILAWVANAIAYGVSSTLNVHAPALLFRRGGTALDFGVFLGIVFAAQTVSFAAVSRTTPSRGAIVASHGVGLGSLAIFLLVPGTLGSVAAALPLGFALALAYQASLHASLHREVNRGLAAGIHEAVLATGSSIVPFLGGSIAAAGGGPASPFHFCAAILFTAAVASAFVPEKKRERTSGPGESSLRNGERTSSFDRSPR